jgi:hypothetical protein
MGGVRQVLRQAARDEEVCDSLHALSRHPDLSRDLSHRHWSVEDATQHEPPCGRQAGRTGELLPDGEQLPVQAEDGLGESAQKLLLASHSITPFSLHGVDSILS